MQENSEVYILCLLLCQFLRSSYTEYRLESGPYHLAGTVSARKEDLWPHPVKVDRYHHNTILNPYLKRLIFVYNVVLFIWCFTFFCWKRTFQGFVRTIIFNRYTKTKAALSVGSIAYWFFGTNRLFILSFLAKVFIFYTLIAYKELYLK